MRKRILAVVLSVCMVLSSAPVNVQATGFTTKVEEKTNVEEPTEEVVVESTTEATEEAIVETTTESTEETTEVPGKQESEELRAVGNTATVGNFSVDYTLDGNNKATITYVDGTGGALDLSNGVGGYEIVAIDDGWDDSTAFDSCNVHSVVLPNTIKTIENYAFEGCKYLTSINIPEGVTSLGECVLSGCTSLTTVTLPSTLTYIGDLAFQQLGNTKAVTLIIPESVTSIDENAFKFCSYLTLKVYAGSYAETWCKSVYGTANHSTYYGWKYTVMNGSTIDISGASYSGVNAQYTYTGGVIQPVPTVVVNGTTLTKDTDYTLTYSAVPMNVGNYTITVTGKGNYEGSFNINYSIVATGINNATISKLDGAAYTGAVLEKIYTGSAITPSVELTFNGTLLEEGLHYQLEYNDNVNVGTATITITGINYFNSERTVSFKIVEPTKSIADATCSTIGTQTYTGSAIEPAFSLTYDGSTLTKGTDYTVEYSNNINAGTATITITGMGKYVGTKTVTFTIGKASIANANITVNNVQYTGSKLTPEPQVVLNGKTLTKGTDYTVAYSNNTDAGTATVTITGAGNYSGTCSKNFTIQSKSLQYASVSGASVVYTGSAVSTTPTVVLDGVTLTYNTDYTATFSNNTAAGTATITVTGKGNYTGTATGTYTIGRKSIESATVSTIAKQTYTGSAICPTVSVTLDGKTLVAGTDYSVAYSNNVNASQAASVVITGMNNYTGKITKTFTIQAASISNATIEKITDCTYDDGNAIKPEPTISVNGVDLVKDTDYTLSYSNNTNIGTATITITGKGNYTGTASTTFQIIAKPVVTKSIEGATVTGLYSVTYNGSEWKLEPTVKVDGVTLTKGTDYTLSYSNNINVGTATITIKGNGTYTGSVTATFQITAKSIQYASIDTISAKTYTGSAIEPSVTVTLDGNVLDASNYTVSYSNNINAGTATVKVTGKGNYTGTISGSFNIVKKSIDTAVIASVSDQTYTGSSITPTVTVTIGDKTLTKGTDYTVTYGNNTSVGTATITITGSGNYTGEKKTTFKIVAINMSGATVSVASGTYTGSAVEPSVSVVWNNKTLVKGTDYTVSYSNNVNASQSAQVIVTGMNNYTGTVTKTFTINAASISNASVESLANYTYDDGNAIKPEPMVTVNGTTLVKGTDYTLSYSNNVNVGTATITITGKGNYTGTKSTTFQIVAKPIVTKSIEGATVSELSSMTYTGSELKPEPTVKVDGATLTKGTDYTLTYSNNVNVGTATITIKGNGTYTGSVTATFTINAKSITGATIGTIANQTYTGSAIKPSVNVTLDGKTLTSGTNYTVSYSNNTNVGTATVTITGKGNYTGTATGSFKITAQSVNNATISTIANQVYTGSAITPAVTVTLGGKTLTAGTDYTVTYNNNTNVGTATVTITGKGNYTGSTSTYFNILDATTIQSIEEATVSTIGAKTYTGSAIKPTPTITLNGVTLVKDSDYTLAWNNNVNVGTATLTITGIGGYTGIITKTFTIAKRSISAGTVSGIVSKTYTGSAATQNITLKLTIGTTTKTLVKGTHYTVSYSNNINAGTATVTLTGKGNYTGTIKKTFTIAKKSIATGTVSGIVAKTYTGSATTQNITLKLKVGNTTKTLTKGTSYTVTYSNNINAGTATVTIKGKGNYTGTIKKTYKINPASIAKILTNSFPNVYYKGSAYKPAVKVKLGSKFLTQNKDFTVTYSNNTNVGQAYVIITGKGNYTGKVTKYFLIYPKTTRIGATASGNRAFQVKWYATPQVSGYHVQYSLRSDFKTYANAYVAKNYNYKTVSGLQSRKYYYVRVRTYANVKVNGKYVRLWSGWSPAVRVATK